jgi:hypothetical protein
VEAQCVEDPVAHDRREVADERLLGLAGERAEVPQDALEDGVHDVARAEAGQEPGSAAAEIGGQPLVHESLDDRIEALGEELASLGVPLPRSFESVQEGVRIAHRYELNAVHGRPVGAGGSRVG